ncbi:MAG: TonB-dependent receptor [Acidobacteria bacterium]|nr:TonB-dependent receptor [Acidobacteriota bacterium]
MRSAGASSRLAGRPTSAAISSARGTTRGRFASTTPTRTRTASPSAGKLSTWAVSRSSRCTVSRERTNSAPTRIASRRHARAQHRARRHRGQGRADPADGRTRSGPHRHRSRHRGHLALRSRGARHQHHVRHGGSAHERSDQRLDRERAPARRRGLRSCAGGGDAHVTALGGPARRRCEHEEHGRILRGSQHVERVALGLRGRTVGPFQGFSVTAQVARGFRDPTLSDRYYRGPTGRGFITGNPDLEPETSLQYDLALRWTIGATRLAAYAYHYDIDDLVERFQDTPDFFFFRNRGEARLRGYEFEMQAPLGRDFAVEIAAQTARGTSRDDDADLDDMPADSVSLTLRREFGARGYANARLAWFADDDRPGPTEIETKGYSIVDLGAGWRVSDALEFRAHVRNLLDREYVSSPDARNVLAPGRSAMVTLVTGF